MYKKIALVSAGLLLVSSPLFVSAQTTTSSTASLIATLTALVQKLEAELQSLIAAHSSGGSTQQTITLGTTTTVPAGCSTYAALQKGNTDATTGGQVTSLQQFLGISPTTGYYGAQTSIAYQNKCGSLGNASPSSVAGMTEYTDSNFGFSFWYPSGWKVSKSTTTGSYSADNSTQTAYPTITISSGSFWLSLSEITSSSGIDELCDGCTERIYFDSTKGQWMKATSEGASGISAHPLDTSLNSMGGLHVFEGGIVPLSASTFIGVESGSDPMPLINTITATNPAVAIPVSTAQQTATIQAQANAYGVTGTSNAISVSPTSGPAPLTVTFTNLPTTAAEVDLDFGDGGPQASDGKTGSWPTGGVVHTYTKPGTYTASVVGEMSDGYLGGATITVTGASNTSTALQTYTNTQYGFTLQYPNQFSPSVTFNGTWSVPSGSWDAYASADPNSKPVVSFSSTANAYGQGTLLVGVSSNQTDVAQCNSLPASLASWVTTYGTTKLDIGTVTINGISFYHFESGGAGLGHINNIESYRTVHNGMCYAIDILLDSTSDVGFNAAVQPALESAVTSFRFMQ